MWCPSIIRSRLTFARAIDRAIDQNRKSDSFFFFTKDAGLAASINGVLGGK